MATASGDGWSVGGISSSLPGERLTALERLLGERLADEESRLPRPRGEPTLLAHSLRVARLAHELALATSGASADEAYLAGLLHDAGKLARLADRGGDLAEEERSALVALDLIAAVGLDPELGGRVADAIRELYREAVEPCLTTRLVADADSLDKLGLPGVAVFFVKQGLRGVGLGPRLLAQVGVELTYARYAAEVAWTEAGRRLAAARARESERFFRAFVRSVSRCGLHPVRVRTLHHGGFELTVVVLRRCGCGSRVRCAVESYAGSKCTVLRLEQSCVRCDWSLITELCRPKLRAAVSGQLSAPPTHFPRSGRAGKADS
jgi:5'-deoxynucleotidase YfbR-like HD superfamily hydrolase